MQLRVMMPYLDNDLNRIVLTEHNYIFAYSDVDSMKERCEHELQ